MLSSSSKRSLTTRNVVAPTLLLFTLSVPLYLQIQRLLTSTRTPPEMYSLLGLWLSLLMACICWFQLLVMARAHAGVLEALEEQTERSEQEKLSQAAEAMQHYSIFMLDPKGYVASWDRDAERLLGYTGADAISRHLSMFYSDVDSRQGKPTHDLLTATTEGRSDDERWIIRKDGFRFKASVAIVAIRDPGGNLCGFTHVIRDNVADSSE